MKLYSTLARFYDVLEGVDRDYARDAQWMDSIFRRHGCQRIIDVPCGTGAHIVELAKLGYDMTGLDASPAMLRVAAKKLRRQGLSARLREGNMLNIGLGGKFDAAICMSWSLAGFLADEEVSTVFKNVRRLLAPPGFFILDVQNARGIRMELLNRLFVDRIAQSNGSKILRLNFSRLDQPDLLDWRACYLIQRGTKPFSAFERTTLRFFYVESLQRLLNENGFRVAGVWSGPYEPFKKNAPGFYVVAKADQKKG